MTEGNRSNLVEDMMESIDCESYEKGISGFTYQYSIGPSLDHEQNFQDLERTDDDL